MAGTFLFLPSGRIVYVSVQSETLREGQQDLPIPERESTIEPGVTGTPIHPSGPIFIPPDILLVVPPGPPLTSTEIRGFGVDATLVELNLGHLTSGRIRVQLYPGQFLAHLDRVLPEQGRRFTIAPTSSSQLNALGLVVDEDNEPA